MSIVLQLALDFTVDKRCTRCGISKPLSEYHKQVRKPDGHKSYCKACCKEINAAHHAAMDRDELRVYRQHYYAEHKDTIKANARRNYHANTAQYGETVKRWQAANRDKVRIYNMRARHRNPAPYRESVRRRYARRKGASVVPFTVAQLRQKCAYWGNRCWICGGPQEAIDHVKPLAKGGLHVLCNQRPICRLCNSSKGDRWPYP